MGEVKWTWIRRAQVGADIHDIFHMLARTSGGLAHYAETIDDTMSKVPPSMVIADLRRYQDRLSELTDSLTSLTDDS